MTQTSHTEQHGVWQRTNQAIQQVLNVIVRMLGGTSMIKFLIRRLLAAIPVLLAILLVTFILSHQLPGGPFKAIGQRRIPEYVQRQLEEKFGLNKSLLFNTWNDGYCPENENRMEEVGCYNEYRTQVAQFEQGAAMLPGLQELYTTNHLRYENDVEQYAQTQELFPALQTDYQTYLVVLTVYVESKIEHDAYQAALTAYDTAQEESARLEEEYTTALAAVEALRAEALTYWEQPDADRSQYESALKDSLATLQTLIAQRQEAETTLTEAQAEWDKYQEYQANEEQHVAELDQNKAELDLAVETMQEYRVLGQYEPYLPPVSGEWVVELEIAQDTLTTTVDFTSTTQESPSVQEEPEERETIEVLAELLPPREPVAPEEPQPAWTPKKPKAWSFIPITRYERRTISGSDTSIDEKITKVVRIDFLDSQFFNYMWDALHLNFGPSLNVANRQLNVSVGEEISKRLPVSMQVGVFAVVLGFLLGIPLGVLAAVYQNSAVDYVSMFFAVLGQATPAIVLAPILIIIFAVELNWVPVADSKNQWNEGPELSFYYLKILALPVITLGTGMSAGIARLTRASLLQVLREDYVRTARAKGLRERVVIYVHALKNAMIPVATILGPLLAGVLTGTFVVELIFVIPGLGKVFVDSVTARDYTMIMGVALLYSIFLIIGNIMVDIMYTWLDPRIRFD